MFAKILLMTGIDFPITGVGSDRRFLCTSTTAIWAFLLTLMVQWWNSGITNIQIQVLLVKGGQLLGNELSHQI